MASANKLNSVKLKPPCVILKKMKNPLVMKIPFIRLLKIAGIMIFSNIIFAPGVKVENWNQPHLLHKIESSQNTIVIFFF